MIHVLAETNVFFDICNTKKRSYLTFRVKADHAEKVIRKHIDKLFHKDRETRRKDK